MEQARCVSTSSWNGAENVDTMKEMVMSEQKTYNPREHLVKIRSKDGGMKDYYPAAWRLYELTLRYPNANFSSEIMLLDVERNLVVVKCRLYLGASYEESEKKTEALKSGTLSTLDKVETAAKARCARDFGISTELALETDLDGEVDLADEGAILPPAGTRNGHNHNHQVDETVKARLNALYPRAVKVKLCGASGQSLLTSIAKLAGVPSLTMEQLTLSQLDILEKTIHRREAERVTG
jgi:hypothetical protein